MVLLGHNGAGKSTLISWMLGFYNDVSQHLYLEKLSAFAPMLDRHSVGYAPEAAYLDANLSAQDYINLIAVSRGAANIDTKSLLETVSLQVDPGIKIGKLSKGMKQRLLLALALIGSPATLILDEPTSGLDPFGRAQVEALLLKLSENHNLIISTHSLEFALALADEIWILKEGDVVYRGRPESLDGLTNIFFSFAPNLNVG